MVCSGFSGRYAHNGFAASGDWKNTDLAIATGCTSLPQRYNTDKWRLYGPNCIDPCVFYDDDDNLWMSYGSWFAGIFMIKLDKENGLRDYTYTYPYQVKGVTTTAGAADANATSDPYFGKKIAGGWDVSNVTDMGAMFYNCEKFNQDISDWNVSKVVDMDYMFSGCREFNQDISDWDVSKVNNTTDIFDACKIKDEYKPNFKI